MVARRAPGYPGEQTVARRVLDVIYLHGPMNAQQLSERLLRKPASLVRPITLMVVGGWLIPNCVDPVSYSLSDKGLALVSQPRPAWDTSEHREWMTHHREQYITKLRREQNGGRP